MKIRLLKNKKGVSIIELLVVLVISGIVVAGIYRVFVAQSKAYTVQDQEVEIQQNIRSAMEILLRDLRMTGCDDDSLNSPITIINPIVVDPDNNSHVTVNYEHFDQALGYQLYTVDYSRDATGNLIRTWTTAPPATTTTETISNNVDALNFTYGVDTNGDGTIENWVPAAGVGGTKIVAVRVRLTVKPETVNAQDDRFKMLTPRTLTTTVALRNLCLR
jgi:prepilin-type N-terminal cleavage/methylation domain-containing protein